MARSGGRKLCYSEEMDNITWCLGRWLFSVLILAMGCLSATLLRISPYANTISIFIVNMASLVLFTGSMLWSTGQCRSACQLSRRWRDSLRGCLVLWLAYCIAWHMNFLMNQKPRMLPLMFDLLAIWTFCWIRLPLFLMEFSTWLVAREKTHCEETYPEAIMISFLLNNH